MKGRAFFINRQRCLFKKAFERANKGFKRDRLEATIFVVHHIYVQVFIVSVCHFSPFLY